MVHIKTKEGASLWIALLATAIVAVGMVIQHIEWWITLCTSVGVFVVVALAALFIIRKYVAYKLKPIYSIVLSRDVHTNEIFSELKDKRVENIGEELTAWADTNDREIARLKEAECFRKQYLGNVAHELKTPIFNIQGYISTLLDGGLEDELINRKYLERAEKSIDRLINIVNDLDTISKLESSMNKLNLERFDVVALAKEIAEQAEMEADKKGIRISIKGADNLPSPFWVLADKHYIGQVFVNLIINSIRYGKEGGQTRIRFRDMLDKCNGSFRRAILEYIRLYIAPEDQEEFESLTCAQIVRERLAREGTIDEHYKRSDGMPIHLRIMACDGLNKEESIWIFAKDTEKT